MSEPVDGSKQVGGDAADGGPAQLSGHLQVSDLLFVDSDVADTERTPKSNDVPADAQTVGSPGLVGGYLGVTALGPDKVDVYQVALGGNEALTLYISTPTGGGTLPDFNLALYDNNGTLLNQSTGTGPVEMLKAPAAGTYYIGVFLADRSAPGLYTLSIASAPSANMVRLAAHDALNPAWPLVPGEALVKLRPQTAAARADAWSRLGVRPLSSGQNAVGYFRVALAPLSAAKTTVGSALPYDAASTVQAIKRLRKSADVAYAEPNYKRSIHAAPPNDPLFSYQWHYQTVSLLDAWDHSKGAGTVVAVLDTGAKNLTPTSSTRMRRVNSSPATT